MALVTNLVSEVLPLLLASQSGGIRWLAIYFMVHFILKHRRLLLLSGFLGENDSLNANWWACLMEQEVPQILFFIRTYPSNYAFSVNAAISSSRFCQFFFSFFTCQVLLHNNSQPRSCHWLLNPFIPLNRNGMENSETQPIVQEKSQFGVPYMPNQHRASGTSQQMTEDYFRSPEDLLMCNWKLGNMAPFQQYASVRLRAPWPGFEPATRGSTVQRFASEALRWLLEKWLGRRCKTKFTTSRVSSIVFFSHLWQCIPHTQFLSTVRSCIYFLFFICLCIWILSFAFWGKCVLISSAAGALQSSCRAHSGTIWPVLGNLVWFICPQIAHVQLHLPKFTFTFIKIASNSRLLCNSSYSSFNAHQAPSKI